jgi:hypothetical protein
MGRQLLAWCCVAPGSFRREGLVRRGRVEPCAQQGGVPGGHWDVRSKHCDNVLVAVKHYCSNVLEDLEQYCGNVLEDLEQYCDKMNLNKKHKCPLIILDKCFYTLEKYFVELDAVLYCYQEL